MTKERFIEIAWVEFGIPAEESSAAWDTQPHWLDLADMTEESVREGFSLYMNKGVRAAVIELIDMLEAQKKADLN